MVVISAKTINWLLAMSKMFKAVVYIEYTVRPLFHSYVDCPNTRLYNTFDLAVNATWN